MSATPVLCFHGLGSYVSLGTHPIYRINRDITLEAWVKVERSIPWAGLISRLFHTGDVQSGYGMLLDGKTGLYFALKTTDAAIVYLHTGPGAIRPGEWHHVAMTWDGERMLVYVDGVEVASQNAKGSAIDYDPDNDLAFGHLHDSNEDDPYVGRLAEVRVWRVARSAAEIEEAMYDRITGTRPGLVSCWPLAEGAGGTIADACGAIGPAQVTATTWAPDTLPDRPAKPGAGLDGPALILSGRAEVHDAPALKQVTGGDRVVRVPVTFEAPFAKAPKVVAGIDYLDVADGPNTRLQVRAEDIRADGFTLVFRTWADTVVFGCAASWVASVPTVVERAEA